MVRTADPTINSQPDSGTESEKADEDVSERGTHVPRSPGMWSETLTDDQCLSASPPMVTILVGIPPTLYLSRISRRAKESSQISPSPGFVSRA